MVCERIPKMKKILIISFSEISRDPRVMRQIQTLVSAGHDISVVGYGSKPDAEIKFHGLEFKLSRSYVRILRAFKLIFRRFEEYYWSQPYIRDAFHAIEDGSFDIVLANDLLALPIACRVGGKARIVFDAHEYAPREFEDLLRWRILYKKFNEYLCETYLKQVDQMSTVCDGISQEYRAQYGVSPRVIHNAPSLQALAPSPVSDGCIRMIHHGIAVPSRKLELMIQMMGHLDERYTLDLMLVSVGGGYINSLKESVATNDRVKIIDPVPMMDICRKINSYDVGVFLLPPVNFNYLHALPNKFFEFVQARLAVAVGPSPEMAELTRRYDLGVVSDGFEPYELAAKLNALTAEDIRRYKSNSDRAARDLSFEKSAESILDMIEAV
jgi:hypothetical protein